MSNNLNYRFGNLKNLSEMLFPLRRSLVGDAARESLEILDDKYRNLRFYSYPSRDVIGKWEIPLGWKVKGDISIGTEIFCAERECFLVPWGEASLKQEINNSDVKNIAVFGPRPDVYHYRTNYYGTSSPTISLPGRVEKKAAAKGLRINIESQRFSDFMHIGEFYRRGRSRAEIVFSTYTCHPCLANDNLSGIMVAKYLCDYISELADPYYSYRVLFFPETIGAQLAIRDLIDGDYVLHAFVLTCLGGNPLEGIFKMSKWPSLIEKVALDAIQEKYRLRAIPFTPDGSDERQYSSCKKRISASTISFSQFYRYKEYHCSDDDLGFLNLDTLVGSIRMYEEVIDAIEELRIPKSNMEYGEPCISAYKMPGFHSGGSYLPFKDKSMSYLQILDLCDGQHSESDIIKRMGSSSISRQRYNLLMSNEVIAHV